MRHPNEASARPVIRSNAAVAARFEVFVTPPLLARRVTWASTALVIAS
jgi:hypothetical protein